ncbi:sodium ion-translocating decarboxylase subunit beta, partial [Klebsiella pneumoniae]
TLGILVLGVIAFCVGTAAGVLMAKLMNVFSRHKINPLIGSAGGAAGAGGGRGGGVPAGLGHPLSRLPRVQEKVGQIAGLLLVNRSLLEQAAALRFSAIEANLAKVTITDNAIQAVNIALELTGNHGLSRQNPLERHYRNVLCGRVHTPQSDSAWLAAGNFVFQSQG